VISVMSSKLILSLSVVSMAIFSKARTQQFEKWLSSIQDLVQTLNILSLVLLDYECFFVFFVEQADFISE
jgi:hypothetical protein